MRLSQEGGTSAVSSPLRRESLMKSRIPAGVDYIAHYRTDYPDCQLKCE